MRFYLTIVALLFCCTAGADSPPEIHFTVDHFTVEGENPIGEEAAQAALAPFLGEYSGLEGLYAAADALQAELGASGYTFHRVVVPPQTLEGGGVTLKVVTFKLGTVSVRGNQYFGEDLIRRSLPILARSEVPNTSDLSQQLAVANEHPRRQVQVNFRESETETDTLDAVVNVLDQRTWGLFAALNNIGTKDTGYTRMSVGGQYSNALGLDDVFTGSFTTSPDNADDVQQYGFFYQVPVYVVGGWASGFYVRSDVDVGSVADAFDVSGAGHFVGLNFRRPLATLGRYHHTLSAGLQDRMFDTAISNTFNGAPLPGISSEVRTRPISVRYEGDYYWQTETSLGFYVEVVRNLSFGGHNNTTDYEAVRPGADTGWTAVRFGTSVTQPLEYDFTSVIKIVGQWTDDPLIPGEQFGLGGERSIRGFEERTVSGDQAIQGTLELWSPEIPQLYGLRLLGFIDGGYKHLEQPTSALQLRSDTLASVGLGARWQWHDQLLVVLDYGNAIVNAGGEAADRGNAKWHFNIEYRY